MTFCLKTKCSNLISSSRSEVTHANARSLSASDLLMLTDANWRARPRPSPPSAGRGRRAGRADARIIKDSLCVPPSMKLKGRVSLGFCLEGGGGDLGGCCPCTNHRGCLMIGSTNSFHTHTPNFPLSWISLKPHFKTTKV